MIKENLKKIRQQIIQYENLYERHKNSVFLLAISKGQPLQKIKQAMDAGQFAFGENYLQEALPKIQALSQQTIQWHFVGSIQSNKTKRLAEYFDWVHTVSDAHIAKRLSEQRLQKLPLNICLQVNITQESNKSGCYPEEVLSLAQQCVDLPHLKLRGLMAIPFYHSTFEKQRAEFKKLRLLYEQLIEKGFALDTLSIGMTEDLEAAIAEGATIVRVGKGIFGERQKRFSNIALK